MSYLSKDILLNSYIALSKLTNDPNAQGQTQYVSIIRYFCALDSYFRNDHRKVKWDINSADEQKSFFKEIGRIVSINKDEYTKNFFIDIDNANDYGTRSNFISAGAYKDSILKKTVEQNYPKRWKPLFSIKNGVLIRKQEYYSNILFYLSDEVLKCAFVIWILRNHDFETFDFQSCIMALNEYQSREFVEAIQLNEEVFNNFCANVELQEQPEVFDKETILNLFPRKKTKEEKSNNKMTHTSLQQIFYGAPGTGKSHTVDDACKKFSHHRVTFHPDSDYSTFVGCYKPTKENTIGVLSQSELINKLTEIKDTGTTYPCHKFSVKYWESLIKLPTPQIKELLLACGFTDSMTTEVSKGVSIGQHFNDIASNKSITYAFTPQAFTNAYIEAWQKQAVGESVFLVIEEINRGNCAQIFGDLFQLLDRDGKGFSKYEIVPDKDLQDYIATNGKLDVSGIKDSDGNDISCEINNGSLLKLPDNLYIWATMNTSDQSLFPIDSAFKRRWDWKYVPIKNHADKNFKIKFDYEVENKYEDGNITFSTESYEQDWWNFIDAVNVRIESATHSEDKQLGYFFCNPDDGIIDGSMFVSKVIFYLWNDVFKNTGSKSVFNVNNKKVPFTAFYLIDDEEIERQKEFNPDGLNLELVKDFIEEIIKNKAQ